MTDLATWWRGARPRTLGAGLVPVLVGAAAAGHVVWWRFIAAALVACGLQIGVNLANDAFDAMKGVDTPDRVGPPRLTQTGAASPRAVLIAALASLVVAGFAGLALALATSPVLILLVGALALVAALLYSGGPRPNAGLGLGELEATTIAWATELLEKSPLALRLLKSGYNAGVDGLAGVQHLAGDATLLYYMSEEAQEGRDAYKEKRTPDFSRFPKRP